MKGIPPELVYALIFVGVILFQFMKRRSATKAARAAQARQAERQAEPEPVDPPTAFDNFLDFGRPEQPAPLVWAPPPVTVESSGPAPAFALSRDPGTRPQRRFSRQSLMGSRRDMQDAMVIAAILGRCRAFQPHDVPQ